MLQSVVLYGIMFLVTLARAGPPVHDGRERASLTMLGSVMLPDIEPRTDGAWGKVKEKFRLGGKRRENYPVLTPFNIYENYESQGQAQSYPQPAYMQDHGQAPSKPVLTPYDTQHDTWLGQGHSAQQRPQPQRYEAHHYGAHHYDTVNVQSGGSSSRPSQNNAYGQPYNYDRPGQSSSHHAAAHYPVQQESQIYRKGRFPSEPSGSQPHQQPQQYYRKERLQDDALAPLPAQQAQFYGNNPASRPPSYAVHPPQHNSNNYQGFPPSSYQQYNTNDVPPAGGYQWGQPQAAQPERYVKERLPGAPVENDPQAQPQPQYFVKPPLRPPTSGQQADHYGGGNQQLPPQWENAAQSPQGSRPRIESQYSMGPPPSYNAYQADSNNQQGSSNQRTRGGTRGSSQLKRQSSSKSKSGSALKSLKTKVGGIKNASPLSILTKGAQRLARKKNGQAGDPKLKKDTLPSRSNRLRVPPNAPGRQSVSLKSASSVRQQLGRLPNTAVPPSLQKSRGSSRASPTDTKSRVRPLSANRKVTSSRQRGSRRGGKSASGLLDGSRGSRSDRSLASNTSKGRTPTNRKSARKSTQAVRKPIRHDTTPSSSIRKVGTRKRTNRPSAPVSSSTRPKTTSRKRQTKPRVSPAQTKVNPKVNRIEAPNKREKNKQAISTPPIKGVRLERTASRPSSTATGNGNTPLVSPMNPAARKGKKNMIKQTPVQPAADLKINKATSKRSGKGQSIAKPASRGAITLKTSPKAATPVSTKVPAAVRKVAPMGRTPPKAQLPPIGPNSGQSTKQPNSSQVPPKAGARSAQPAPGPGTPVQGVASRKSGHGPLPKGVQNPPKSAKANTSNAKVAVAGGKGKK